MLPFEITAAGITISYWHEYNIGVWVAVFMVPLALVQFFGVRGYGEGNQTNPKYDRILTKPVL